MFTIFFEFLFALVCETYYNGRSRVIYPSNDIGEVYRDLAQKVFFLHLKAELVDTYIRLYFANHYFLFLCDLAAHY